MQLLTGMSTNRYFPANGTAGFDRSLVSGKSREPAPPPMMMESVLSEIEAEATCIRIKGVRKSELKCGLLPGRKSDPLHPPPLLWAKGGNLRIIFECVVNNTSIVRVHRIELEWNPTMADLLCNFSDTTNQRIISHGPIVFHVDMHARSILIRSQYHPIQQELQVINRDAVVSNQPILLRTIDLEVNSMFIDRLFHLSHKTQVPQKGFQHFLGFDSHNSILLFLGL